MSRARIHVCCLIAVAFALCARVSLGADASVPSVRGAMISTPIPIDALVPDDDAEAAPTPETWAANSLEIPFSDESPLTMDPGAPLLAVPYPTDTHWYTRFDYYSWRETVGGAQILHENGTMYNLGCMRRRGNKRFRLEIFDGDIQYTGHTQSDLYVASSTNYLGLRGECEAVWDLSWCRWRHVSLFAGVGTRFWIRDIEDGYMPASAGYATGYQETWWTIYPYIGLEKQTFLSNGSQLYLSGRLGLTAVTYQLASLVTYDENLNAYYSHPLYPAADITAQVELGLRDDHVLIAAYFDAMTWGASPVVSGWYQPASQMVSVGIKFGLTY